MKPIKSFTDGVDVQTNNQNSNILCKRIYSLPIRMDLMKNISTKVHKNKNKRIFNQLNVQPSWFHTNVSKSMSDQSMQQSLPLPDLSKNSYNDNNYQSIQRTSFNSSSSENSNSDYFLHNNPFLNKIKHPSVILKHGQPLRTTTSDSFSSDRNSIFESFFPDNTFNNNYTSHFTSESVKEDHQTRKEQSKYCNFEQKFHWLENIEHYSPWIRHRTREIFNSVNDFYKKEELDILKNDCEQKSRDSKTDIIYEDCSETDDQTSYEIVNKLCNTLLKHGTASTSDKSENQSCLLNDNLKWTKLYEKILNSEQAE